MVEFAAGWQIEVVFGACEFVWDLGRGAAETQIPHKRAAPNTTEMSYLPQLLFFPTSPLHLQLLGKPVANTSRK
jgi:hypothetical protein